MIKTLKNAFMDSTLRKKIFFTLFIIIIFRIGSIIPVPFLNTDALASLMNDVANSGSALGYLNMLSGNAFSNASLFAMSITPYINASIIMQLMTIVIPRLEALSKEGEEGRKKVTKITRIVSVALGVAQGTAFYLYLRSSSFDGVPITLYNEGFGQVFSAIVIILTFTAGTALLMWLGEQINKHGIGNGISIILFAGIVAQMPQILVKLYEYFMMAVNLPDFFAQFFVLAPIFLLIFFVLIWVICFMNDSERRIPVQYAKRVVGRKMYDGQSTFIPIKISATGVMPVIFASSLLSIPSTIKMFMGDTVNEGFWAGFFSAFESGGWLYCIIYGILILLFAFFYITVQYNPMEMANALKQNHGAIPGIRPGKPTSTFIAGILSKITFIGALFLVFIALVPIVYGSTTGMSNVGLGGTSIIILVGVALETVKQLESQLMMRTYKGFLD